MDTYKSWYGFGVAITWMIVFFGAWIYCAMTYGFLFGFGIGWLPAAILATICCWFWPLAVLFVIISLVV